MSTQHIVGIVGGSNFRDQYTIDKIRFDKETDAFQFMRNYNRSFDSGKSHYVRAEYLGEIDTDTGDYV